MHIREFTEGDRNRVIKLWDLCGLTAPQNDPNKDIDRKLLVGRDLFLVGEIEGRVAATVMGGYEGHRGWINYLAVDPEFRRLGIGKAVMLEVEKRLRKKGCPKINLQVRRTNTDVVNFYMAMGFGDDNVLGLGKRLE